MYQIWDSLATCSLMEGLTPEGWIIVDVRDLKDGEGNSIEAVKTKIIIIGNLLACGQKVCIRCLAGMSRSNTLACAAMMLFTMNHHWDHEWNVVIKACPRAHQNQDFVDTVKRALLELGTQKERLY